MISLKNKKILIFGTGAVGGYYGGVLVKAGFDVVFVARGENHEVLREKGLTLIRNGKKEIIPINVLETRLIASLQKTFDYILICVKSKDTKSAAESIKNIVGPNTTVASFQNGVENEKIIASIVGEDKVIGALVFIATQMTEPGVVIYVGDNRAVLGELDGKIKKRVTDLQKILESTGTQCAVSTDIYSDMWNKLIWNTAFNPLSVLTGKTSDEIVKDKKLWMLVKNIMTEVKDVAVSLGFKIMPDFINYYYERSVNLKGFKTSMLQDFERGNPIEIEELVGVVIRKAKEKNIKVPTVEKVYNEVKKKISLVV